MKSIYKYPLKVIGRQTLSLPEGAEILTVQVQGTTPCLWVLLDTDDEPTAREILTYGTGHEISQDTDDLAYIGTYQIEEDKLVFHVFEVL